jgi:hypothetical protein
MDAIRTKRPKWLEFGWYHGSGSAAIRCLPFYDDRRGAVTRIAKIAKTANIAKISHSGDLPAIPESGDPGNRGNASKSPQSCNIGNLGNLGNDQWVMRQRRLRAGVILAAVLLSITAAPAPRA